MDRRDGYYSFNDRYSSSLGIGGMELFIAEAPGPTKDKIHPRIKETAKRLWIIYLGLTSLENNYFNVFWTRLF